MNNPEYIKIDGEKYKINTDFRVAIKCDAISQDKSVPEFETMLAIIYLLFGDKGLNDKTHYAELFEYAIKYLNCNKGVEKKDERDMDFTEDMDYIEASFMSDYHIDLANTQMHWWTFYKLLCGLSNSELGNCCILNRIRNLRNFDASKIEDTKERQKIIQAQKEVALKKDSQEYNLTEEQERSMEELNKILGL